MITAFLAIWLAAGLLAVRITWMIAEAPKDVHDWLMLCGQLLGGLVSLSLVVECQLPLVVQLARLAADKYHIPDKMTRTTKK